MKKISIHKPSKCKYSDIDFQYYLAGIIDGDGHINTQQQIVIVFNEKEEYEAHSLMKRVGYGNVKRIKNKKAITWIISDKKGVIFVANLIKNKIKHPIRIKQYNTRLYPNWINEKTSENSIIDWDTPWFSGFFDTDGSFRLYILKRKRNSSGFEFRLLVQIDQKDDVLLNQIKKKFGGYLGYRKKNDTYYYSSVSFASMSKLLLYFDKFNPQYKRYYLRYVIMRKCFLLVQDKKHLIEKGIQKLINYQKKLRDMI